MAKKVSATDIAKTIEQQKLIVKLVNTCKHI